MRHGPVRSGICPSVPHVQLYPLLIRYESLTQVQARKRELEVRARTKGRERLFVCAGDNQ